MRKIIIYALTTTVSITFFAWLFSAIGETSDKPKKTKKNFSDKKDTTFTVLFGGDMMGHQPMIAAAYNDSMGTYDYLPWFQFVSPIINNVDYAIANLEVTLAGPPYSGYPQFSSPDSYAAAIKAAGFDFLVTANNHSQDRDKVGLERTIRILDSLNIQHTGTFVDSNVFRKSHPAVITIKGCKIALLNYTYGTNGLVVKHPNVVNIIDTHRIKIEMKKANTLGVDAIIPVMHWGLEYMTTESSEQSSLASFMAKHGATAIIGMHPHVVQPIRSIKTMANKSRDSILVPVAYSLGNFVSNQREINRDGGIMVRLTFRKKNGNLSLVSWDYIPFWVWRLQGNLPIHHLKRGYYIITENQLGMLSGDDLDKANLFFSNVRKNLAGTSEWKFLKN